MYPRTEYEMTEDDLAELLEASKPVAVMKIGNYAPKAPQENANNAWARLGEKMGFDSMTVQPVSGKGQCFFTAIPSETEEQQSRRKAAEAEQARVELIEKLTKERDEINARLEKILAD